MYVQSGKVFLVLPAYKGKQSFSPLKVQAHQGSKAAEGNLSFEAAFAAEAGITLSQFQDENVPISKGISWN